MPQPDIESLRSWIGRSEEDHDVATLAPAALLAATLDRKLLPSLGDALPVTWHWLYFLAPTRSRDLGEDGLPRRGGFMPPVDLPRRMWAGSRIEVFRSIRIGDAIHRRTTIADLSVKKGRSGALVFVRVATQISTDEGLALVEERDVVFREHPRADASAPKPLEAPGDAAWYEHRVADPVLLFRYSALTFNSHRIHYDQAYATENEAYPGLVVQGPLLATLLAELLSHQLPQSRVRSFAVRAVSAQFVHEPFVVAGRPNEGNVDLWAANGANAVTMSAQVQLG